MHTHTLTRPAVARFATLLALVAVSVGLLAGVGTTSASAATGGLSAEKTDQLMGPIHTLAKTYKTLDEDDNVVNRLTVSTDMHNYYWFVAFRAKVTVRFIDADGQRIGDVNGDGQTDGEFVYGPLTACAYFDPTCSHDPQYNFDDRVKTKVINRADHIEIEHAQV